MKNEWLGYYDVEVRTTNHPDTFTSQGVMWDSRERADQEGKRLESTWSPLLEWRVVAYGSERSVTV